MTSNKEDYLKIIYEEGGLEERVPNKVISEKLGIAPASVSEMVTKLTAQGLITAEPYKGALLTEKGLDTCIELVRSHRLWEVFLMRCLGETWREAHEHAHLLEHITLPKLIDRLDAFLEFPHSCPHGSIIPRKGNVTTSIPLQTLIDLAVGETALLYRIIEDGTLLDYLDRSGLQIHKEIEIISIEEFEGPITFMQDSKKITISHKAASQIFVDRNY